MIINKFRFLILCFLALLSTSVSSQVQYQAELGLTGGGGYYMGDANAKLFANTKPDYGVFMRARFNQRIALRIEWNKTQIYGIKDKIEFNNDLSAVDLCGEFNFFDLEKNEYKRLSKPYSPYLFGGVGLMSYNSTSYAVTPSIVFGVGFKVLLGKRFNAHAQWTHRILMADNMENKDAFDDPLALNGSNVFNKDMLSTFTIGFSVDFWEKDCHCKNDSRRIYKPVVRHKRTR